MNEYEDLRKVEERLDTIEAALKQCLNNTIKDTIDDVNAIKEDHKNDSDWVYYVQSRRRVVEFNESMLKQLEGEPLFRCQYFDKNCDKTMSALQCEKCIKEFKKEEQEAFKPKFPYNNYTTTATMDEKTIKGFHSDYICLLYTSDAADTPYV